MTESPQHFPAYALAQYQADRAPESRIVMCASTVASPTLNELLARMDATEREAWDNLSLNYSGDRGAADLRTAICRHYPGLDADNILVFSGAQEAMFCAYHALLTNGDAVLGVEPYFEPLLRLPQAAGGHVNTIALQPKANGWQLDTEQLIASVSDNTRVVVINFPHNPTGALIEIDELDGIIDAARRHGAWLFSDEVFRGLEYNDGDRLPAVASRYDRGVSLGSIAKPFGLGGVRVGWLAAQDRDFLQRCRVIKRSLSICTGRGDEVLATFVLQHSEHWLERSRQIIRGNSQLVESQLSELNNEWRWHSPRAGCVAFPALQHQPSTEFADHLLRESGVLILPGTLFGGESFSDCFRLGLGRSDFEQGFFQFKTHLLDTRP